MNNKTPLWIFVVGISMIFLSASANAIISNYYTEVIAGYHFNNSGLGDVKYNYTITDSGTVPYKDINSTVNYSRKFDTNTDRLILQDMYSEDNQERGLSLWLNATDWTPADSGWIYYSDSAAGGTTSLQHGTSEIAYNVRNGAAYNTIKHVPGWSDGTWHNIIVTWKPGNQTMYLDGVYVNSSTAVNNITYRNDGYAIPYSLGGRNGVESFIGLIDEVIFFDHFVDDNEALEIYHQYDDWDIISLASFVTILSPANNTHINSDNLTVYFNTTILTSTCDFNLNGTYNTSKSYDGSGNDSFTLAINEGIYDVMINCSNITVDEDSDTNTYYIDRSEPPITDNSGLNNTNVTDTTSILNITVGPDYLYMIHVNATCSDGTNIYSQNYSEDGSYQTIILNDTINNSLCPDGDYITVFIQAADSHTAKEIRYIPHVIDQNEKKITFYQGVSIYPADRSSFGTVSTSKLPDRHTFKFKRTKSTGGFDDFYLEGDNVDQIFEGNYADVGHFVEWDGFGGVSHWIDFNTDEGYPVSVLKLGNDKYRVRIDCSKDGCSKDYNFKSLGGLNENNITITYYFDSSNITTTETYNDVTVEKLSINLYLNTTFNTIRYPVLNSVVLTWNNTNYSTGLLDSGTINITQNYSYYYVNLVTPELNDDANITHFWILNFTDESGDDMIYMTDAKNQTVFDIRISVCNATNPYKIINFSYYDELTLAEISPTVDYSLIFYDGTSYNYLNGTFAVANNNSLCTNLNSTYLNYTWNMWGSLSLSLSNYMDRVFTISEYDPTAVSNNPVTDLPLYMIGTANSSTITYTWMSNTFDLLDGVMKIYKCNGDGSKTLVDSQVIVSGEAVANIELITQTYSYEVIIDGVTYTDSSFTTCHVEPDTTATYYVNVGAISVETPIALFFSTCEISKLDSDTAILTFNSHDELDDVTACLEVYRRDLYNVTLYDSNCTDGTSGNVTINVPIDNNVYFSTGYLSYDSHNSFCSGSAEFNRPDSATTNFGVSGIFALILMIIAVVLMFSDKGEKMMLASFIALVIGFFLGIHNFGWVTMSLFFFFGLALMLIGRYSRKP